MRLENGIETMELGVTAWRGIINDNFSKIYTKSEIDAKLSADLSVKNISASGNFELSGDLKLGGMPQFTQALPSANLGEPLGFIKVKVGEIVKIPYFKA